MFGFGKKSKTPGDPDHKASPEAIEPTTPPKEPAPSPPEPALSADRPKKPWFGKLFRSGKNKSPESEAEPEARTPEPQVEPATLTQAPEPVKPAAPKPAPKAPAQTPAAQPPAPQEPVAPPPRRPAPERPAAQTEAGEDQETVRKRGVLKRLRTRLSRTRTQLGDGLGNLFLGRKRIDDDLMEELETLLITADVGMDATTRVIGDLAERVKRKSLADPQALLTALKSELRDILLAADGPVRQPAAGRPQVVLMVGINGAGKTTTIGKLAKRLKEEGNSVMLAAGDTFRAAAVEQLQTWGDRNEIPVIAQHTGADSASVVFDALQAATARGADVLIADTAGRLHTKSNLMDELSKVARVLKKIDPEAPHEVMLVVDATTGQNALNQAEHFHRAVGLTGITLTKLDGTAKGGIIFAVAERLKVPIRFIGVGESIEDLRPFDPDEFIDALLG
ncbi:signal recognition particle-docking protein FtsY [Thiorhodococcus mannitoliphagus]|uniref:Signal recognition particle receptor FtsY n=1 Tax=Thiorhodococcus mannitoliphagus TaxID=329406 RepID=A0A6P1DTA8_9GAMM|nr:signal recognition particle-docking protein FtsY [Thiorhodococcus mannitoliphagus]NEX19262.1 signal recognition particle-docking protein FtsY [Thiorhodococcus mannitoliphagus]